MDVAAYFPANISAVPHDEDEETVTAPTTEENKVLVTAGKRLMTGRKRRDPPLLATILEVPSTVSLIPSDTSVFCLLCLRKISGAVQNFVKPCQCRNVFVHTTCAIDSESFFGGTCSQCNQRYRPEQTTPRQSLSPIKVTPKKMSSASSIPPKPLGAICVLCKNEKYRNPDWPQKCDAKLIRPCFCGFLAHHGCMIELLKSEKECEMCGVKYRYFRYGTFTDFCRRYSIQHVCYILIFVFLLGFFLLALSGSFVSEPINATSITLSILALFFLLVFITACLFMVKHTWLTRLPRFRRRYGKITVVPYDPDVRTKKQALRSLEAARSLEYNEVPTQLELESFDENRSPEATRTDPSDLSLGQHMFGIAANSRMCSSTPLNHKTKATLFNQTDA